MADDKIGPRIMSSSTVRPTIVQAPAMRSEGHAPELTPGVSTVAQVRAIVMGMKVKAAKSRLEAYGFETRVVSQDGEPQEELGGANGECANLTVVGSKVTDVALRRGHPWPRRS